MAEETEIERNEDATDSVGESSKNETPTVVCDVVKGLDANQYATKKTVAQGMLDVALLTSNASQLKYVLQVGPQHEFYTLLVVLISISIVLQVSAGLLAQITSLMEKHKRFKKLANWLYRVSIAMMTVVMFCDAIRMTFGLDPALSMQDSTKIKPST